MSYAPALPHDLPKMLAQDLFVVHGCIKPNPIARFTRNMTIVRDGESLTLINPVRMNDEGLAALDELGRVEHILRLGPMHGIDDQFYVDRYPVHFWSFDDHVTYTEPKIDRLLKDGGALPFADAQLFAFKHMKETEGAIVLQRTAGNVLLTCDGIQSYSTPPHTPHTNKLTKFLMPFIGFPNETLIGPVWVKLLVTDRQGIRDEFERLLDLDFDQLIAAHGTFLSKGAHAEVRRAVDKMFAAD